MPGWSDSINRLCQKTCGLCGTLQTPTIFLTSFKPVSPFLAKCSPISCTVLNQHYLGDGEDGKDGGRVKRQEDCLMPGAEVKDRMDCCSKASTCNNCLGFCCAFQHTFVAHNSSLCCLPHSTIEADGKCRDPCPLLNHDYRSPENAEVIRRVKSWAMCAYHCRQRTDCKYWRWKSEPAFKYFFVKLKFAFSRTTRNWHSKIWGGMYHNDRIWHPSV